MSRLAFLKTLATHPANHGRRLRAYGRALWWQAYRAMGGTSVTTTLDRGIRFRCHPDCVSSRLAYYFYGRYDFDEVALLEHWLRPGDAFLDIGASVGAYTLFAARAIGPSGQVMAFEPSERAAERLKENVHLNGLGNVLIRREAVGDVTGTALFARDDELGHLAAAADGARTTATVSCVRLDDALGERTFTLAKVDVEGAEPLVLQGAERLLAAGAPPLWILEVNGLLQRYGWTEERLASWLLDRGYRLGLYNARERRLDLSPQPWRSRGNVIAVRACDLDQVQARLIGG